MRLRTTVILVFAMLWPTLQTADRESFKVPPRWNPWAPLEIAAEPNWLTHYKLSRLSADADLCRQVLASSSLVYSAVEDRAAGDDCGWRDAVQVRAMPEPFSATLSPAFTLTCRSAVALVMWEHHVLQPAALQYFGRPVARIDHFGTYSCRNVRGGRGEGGRRSQHASANAVDIAGFRLVGGKRISVASHWSRSARSTAQSGEDAARTSAFLRAAHQGACRFFTGALGPDYNALHRDHFHFDRGPYRVCR